MCEECYCENNRITPLNKPYECLKNHTQYICGECGRCICIQKDSKRGVMRWSFPFKSLKEARLYLRTADYTLKKACGIYEIEGKNGRLSYKIFEDTAALDDYLKKNGDKRCRQKSPVYTAGKYKEFPNTRIGILTEEEIIKYMTDREK